MQQQRRVMSSYQLRSELEDIVSNMIPGDERRGPSMSMLRKADVAVDEIMALIEKYVQNK